MVKKALIGACALICAVSLPAYADDGGIGEQFSGKGPVKVFIDKVVNGSGESAINADAFRKVLEESFAERKATSFQVVGDQAGSDITVSAVIRQYRYLARGPIKPTCALAITLIDVAATMSHNYADIVSDFTVVATPTRQILWQGAVEAYVKRTMSPVESVPLVYDKLARCFISKCFGTRRGSVVSAVSR